MYREPLEDVHPPAEVNSSHPAPVVEVLVPAFQFLAALPEEAFASHAPPIRVDGLLFPLLPAPLLPTALRFRAVRPHSRLAQIADYLLAVIALVGNHLARPFRIHAFADLFIIGFRSRLRDLLA